MSELLEKLPEKKAELERLLSIAIQLYQTEDVPRKRLALDRVVRHLIHACSEIYKANLIIRSAYVEKIVKKEKGREAEKSSK